jgi:hypothetical protein
VTIGGQNVLQSVLTLNYETFMKQIMYAEQLTSADFGVSTGLFDAAWWNADRFILLMLKALILLINCSPAILISA